MNKPELLMAGVIKAPAKLKRFARFVRQVEQIAEAIHEHKPDQIWIEGYAVKFRGAAINLIEYGGVLRYELHMADISWQEVAPTSAKLFAAAYGKATKEQLAEAIKGTWGLEHPDYNVTDSIGIALFGLAVHGRLINSAAQMSPVYTWMEKNSATLNGVTI
jgi:Holliday junction resolvasome RuvABC endonuclease subunit